MMKTKRDVGIIVIIVIVATVVIGASIVGFLGGGGYLAYQGRHLRVRLLCETDHQALLDACRELSRQAMSGELEPRTYSVRRRPDPEVAKFPEPIRTLQPAQVAVDRIDGHVTVEMLGGWDNFGVYAYPKDFKERFPIEYNDRELLEGLWYYDDFYKYPGKEEYDKEVSALLTKCGKVKEKTH